MILEGILVLLIELADIMLVILDCGRELNVTIDEDRLLLELVTNARD